MKKILCALIMQLPLCAMEPESLKLIDDIAGQIVIGVMGFTDLKASLKTLKSLQTVNKQFSKITCFSAANFETIIKTRSLADSQDQIATTEKICDLVNPKSMYRPLNYLARFFGFGVNKHERETLLGLSLVLKPQVKLHEYLFDKSHTNIQKLSNKYNGLMQDAEKAIEAKDKNELIRLLEILGSSQVRFTFGPFQDITFTQMSLFTNQEIIGEVLKRAGTITWKNEESFFPVIACMIVAGIDIANLEPFVHAGLNLNNIKFKNVPLFYCAIFLGSLPLIDLCIENGADVNGVVETISPIMVAAAGGRKNIVKKMVNYGADINVVDGGGKSPLLIASCLGSYKIPLAFFDNDKTRHFQQSEFCDIFQILIDSGAVIDSKIATKALELSGNSEEIKQMLIQAGATFDDRCTIL